MVQRAGDCSPQLDQPVLSQAPPSPGPLGAGQWPHADSAQCPCLDLPRRLGKMQAGSSGHRLASQILHPHLHPLALWGVRSLLGKSCWVDIGAPPRPFQPWPWLKTPPRFSCLEVQHCPPEPWVPAMPTRVHPIPISPTRPQGLVEALTCGVSSGTLDIRCMKQGRNKCLGDDGSHEDDSSHF